LQKCYFCKKLVLLLFTAFIFNCPPPGGKPPKGPNPLWPKRLGGTAWDKAKDIVRDHGGSIIITGTVTGDADLNGDGETSDTSESAAGFGGSDIFISIINA